MLFIDALQNEVAYIVELRLLQYTICHTTMAYIAYLFTLQNINTYRNTFFPFSGKLQNINESLFTYKSTSDFAYLNNPAIKPSTFITGIENITDYLSNHCGSTVTEKDINDTCDDNIACTVDMALTCSKQFGNRTRHTQIVTDENVFIAGVVIFTSYLLSH